MSDTNKTNDQLVDELKQAHSRIAELETVAENSKRAEEALRLNVEKYKAFYDNAPLSYQSLDEDGCFLDVNPTWLSTLGYEREEVIGKRYAEFLHPDWKPHFEENFPEFKRRGYVHDVQFRIRHKDGHFLDVAFEGHVGYLPDGSFRQTYCIFKDIMEQKRAEEALRKSEEQLADAVEIAHLAPWEYDVVNDLFTFNDYFYNVFRTTAEQVGGYTMSSAEYARRFVHPDDQSLVGDEVRQVIEATDAHYNRQLEHRILYGDGTIGYITVHFFIIQDEQGRTIKTYGVNQDITDRKQTEEALRESEENLKKAQALTHIGHWSLDPTALEVTGSDELFNIFGITRDEATLDAFTGVVHPDDRDFDLYHINRGIEHGKNWDIEYRLVCKDGTEKVVHAIGEATTDETGKTVQLMGTVQDITERKQAEEALHRSEAQYRLLALNVTDVIWTMDMNLRFTYVSPSIFQQRGYSVEEVMTHSLEKVMTPESLIDVIGVFDKTLKLIESGDEKGWEAITFNVDQYCKDGSIVTTSNNAKLISGPDGKPNLIIGVTHDITEAKRAEAQFEGLFETMPSGVAIYEAVDDGNDFVFKRFNRAGEGIEQVKREDVIGRKVTEVFPGVVERGLLDVFKKVWQTGLPENHPISIYKDDRIIGWRENQIFKLPSEEIVAVYEDLTDKKKAEEVLRESEEKFRTISDQSLLGIIILQDDMFVYVNKQVPVITGIPLEELERWSLSDYYSLIHPDDLGLLIEQGFKKQAGEEDVITNHSWRMVTPEGNLKWIETWSQTIPFKGRNANMVMMIDITDRKQSEIEREELHQVLGERIKELKCLLGISESIRTESTLEQIFSKVVSLIPPAFHYPDIARGRVIFHDQVFVSEPFEETEWKLAADVVVDRKVCGSVEVFYMEECPQLDEGPFFIEERNLIDAIAQLLGQTAKRFHAEEETKKSREASRRLHAELALVEEKQRREISKQLHDDVGPSLALAKLKLAAFREEHSSKEQVLTLAGIGELIGQSIRRMRGLMIELSSPVLFEEGLIAAIEGLCEDNEEKFGISFEVKAEIDESLLQKDLMIFLYQSTRELLRNVQKHASANKVKISISESDGLVQINVEDDGVGGEPSQYLKLPDKDGGFGLFDLRERLIHIGGQVKLDSSPGQGTLVSVKVPLSFME